MQPQALREKVQLGAIWQKHGQASEAGQVAQGDCRGVNRLVTPGAVLTRNQVGLLQLLRRMRQQQAAHTGAALQAPQPCEPVKELQRGERGLRTLVHV